jgi:diguanylate cyclase (GGDEF)-like protein
VILDLTGEADLVGRFGGQRFLVVLVDAGPRAAAKKFEFIRQSIERITFLYGEEEVRVTASGGITEVTADDTHDSLFARVEQALGEAKRAGPNRSCLHDGRCVELVKSPGLGAEYAEIPI